jgi:two-component system chemotaxis response regulator CheY
MRNSEALTYRPPQGRAGLLPMLIVDDEPLHRCLIACAARKAGFCPEEAASSAGALCRLRQASFACVTLDLKLDDGDGIQILRAMADWHYVGSVMIISGADGSSRSDARRMAKRWGIVPSHCFPKPIDLAALRIAFAQRRSQLLGLPMMCEWGEAVSGIVEGIRK